MKLSEISYNLQEAKDFELLNPTTGKSFETPAIFSLLSIESKKGQQIKTELFREVYVLKQENPEMSEADFMEQTSIITSKKLSKLVVNFTGIEDMEYSPENTEELLLKYELISKFVNEKTSYLGNFKQD